MMKTRQQIEKLEKIEKVAKFSGILFLLIILIGLSALVTHAQPTKGVSYESVESYTFLNGTESPAYLPGIIFEFQGDKIIASTKDQTKNLYMRYEWKNRDLVIDGKKVKGKVVEAYDNGGFKCLINYFYDPAAELYVISILYNNVNHVHFMKSSKKKAQPDTIQIWAAGNPFRRDYTDEEVAWFWKNYRFVTGDFTSLSWLE